MTAYPGLGDESTNLTSSERKIKNTFTMHLIAKYLDSGSKMRARYSGAAYNRRNHTKLAYKFKGKH